MNLMFHSGIINVFKIMNTLGMILKVLMNNNNVSSDSFLIL